MSKARAAGVMGVVILCGLLVLSTGLTVASTDAYFATVHGAFKRACSEHALLQTGIEAEAFSEACVFMARVLKNLSPTSVPTEEQITQAALDAFRVPRDCAECVEVIGDLELALVAQAGPPPHISTVQEIIEEALAAGCDQRFSDPAKATQCRDFVAAANVLSLVDLILEQLPPVTACRELKVCPLP
jgi:hypothetical protein